MLNKVSNLEPVNNKHLWDNKAILKMLENKASLIMPPSSLAETFHMGLLNFIRHLNEHEKALFAVIRGEARTYQREKSIFKAMLMSFERSQPLVDSTGKTILKKVTMEHVAIREKLWHDFLKEFEANSITRLYEREYKNYRNYQMRQEFEQNTGQRSDKYHEMLIRLMDKRCGVKVARPAGDLTWRPEHYKRLMPKEYYEK